MPTPWWADLLREQQAARFADLSGADAWLRLPISDRLLTRLIAARIPPTVPISDVDLRAETGNQLTVRIKMAKPSFLPPFRMRLRIERQPELPASPLLVLRLKSEGLAALAGPAMTFFDVLPPWVRMNADQLVVDLAAMAEEYGAADVLSYLTHLEVSTAEGRVIVAARGSVSG